MAIDPLVSSMHIASSGLHSQSTRLRIVSENIANAQSTGSSAGADPYSRKTITFESELDRASGENLVQVKSIGADTTPFRTEHLPGQSRRRRQRPREDAQRRSSLRNGRHARSQSVL